MRTQADEEAQKEFEASTRCDERARIREGAVERVLGKIAFLNNWSFDVEQMAKDVVDAVLGMKP